MATTLRGSDNFDTGVPEIAGESLGKVLQIQQSVMTNVATFALNNTWQASGLSVSITPTSATSKLLVIYKLQFGDAGSNAYPAGRLMKDGSILSGALADIDNVSKLGTSVGGFSSSSQAWAAVTGVDYLDAPATTSQVTYSIDVTGYGSRTFWINRSSANNDVNQTNGISTITVMEIAA